MSKLAEELESLGLREKSGTANRRKVASQWLIKSPQNTILPSEDMDKFPHVSKMRSVVPGLTGGSDFNSCIVNFYADGAARTRPHSDDESFSVGQTRDIGILIRRMASFVVNTLSCQGRFLS